MRGSGASNMVWPYYNPSGINLFDKVIVQADSFLHSKQVGTLIISLDYKGIRPGMAAQPMRTRKTSKL